MRELSLVIFAVVGLALLGYGLQFLAQPAVYEAAWVLMSLLGVLAVFAELVYFAALFVALRANGNVPDRWYARSFAHHKLLTPLQRRLVLPPFFLGALCLVLSLLIAIALVFASIGLFQG